MDYTYLLESMCVKQMNQTLDPNDTTPILSILCYHITDDCKQPFLRFLFKKTTQNPVISEQFYLPYLYLCDADGNINTHNILDKTIEYVRSALKNINCNTDELTDENFKGIIYLNDQFPVAMVNVSNITIDYIKVYRNSEHWFLLPSEVINSKSICNILVDQTSVDMFIKYAPTITLLHSNDDHKPYSLPEAVYSGNEYGEVEFNSIFGQRKRENHSIGGKYFSFYVDFNDAVLEGGWIKNGGTNHIDINDKEVTHNLSGTLLVDNEYGRYIKGGINRYALFIDSPTLNDSRDIKDDEIKYITVHNRGMIVTKCYENFKPLSYHGLNKNILNEKYDADEHYMII